MDWPVAAGLVVAGIGAIVAVVKLWPERRKIEAEALAVQTKMVVDLSDQNRLLFQEIEDLQSALGDATDSAEREEAKHRECAAELERLRAGK